MTGKTLEKITIVPDEGSAGCRLAIAWVTGEGGRQTEIRPDVYADEAAARERALADYGVAPAPGDSSIDRRP